MTAQHLPPLRLRRRRRFWPLPAGLLLSLVFLLVAFAAAVPAAARVAATVEPLDFNQWALLAIQEGGRRKPVDTFATETLLRLSGRRTVEANGRKWSANDFLLSMLLDTFDWKKEPLILVGYKPLVEDLGLDGTRKRFSFEELAGIPKLRPLAAQGGALRKSGQEVPRAMKEAESVMGRLELFAAVSGGAALNIVPPPGGGPGARWLVPTESSAGIPPERYGPVTTHLSELAQAYLGRDNFNFNLHAGRLRESLRAINPAVYPSERELKLEYFYNHLKPFDWAAWLYAIGFAGIWIASASPSRSTSASASASAAAGNRAARWLGLGCALAGVAFHAGGIVARCIIAGRPPVTNMYESVVWVAFGTMAFGLVFFLRYRALTYLLAALPVSMLSLFLLRQLPVAMPEAIDPLVPVLRSNFWLTTHVLTITLSYAAFALAMGFGHIVLYRFIRNPGGTVGQATLHFWLYRVLQLGVLLLAIGTILGGVWANYSWGRFWGWDPKETWALIALLCYIFVLHGRIVGWWDQFGLAVASVLCFLAVLMTWYGVNFVLGKGLHSYGFGLGGETYVASFIALDLAYVAVAWARHRGSVKRRATLAEAVRNDPAADRIRRGEAPEQAASGMV